MEPYSSQCSVERHGYKPEEDWPDGCDSSYYFDCRIQATVQGAEVTGTDSMRVLGVVLDSDCSFKTHVRNLRFKTWALAKLRKHGLDTDSLITAYKYIIRPSVEYLAPVWTAMITAEQSESLKRQQVQALKTFSALA